MHEGRKRQPEKVIFLDAALPSLRNLFVGFREDQRLQPVFASKSVSKAKLTSRR